MEIIKPTCPRCGHEIIWGNDCMSSDISDEFAQDDTSVTSFIDPSDKDKKDYPYWNGN